MADDNKTMMYLLGGGLLIALVVLSSKKANASTGGGGGGGGAVGGGGLGDKLPDLTTLPGTNVVPRTVPGTNVTPVNFVPPNASAPVLRVTVTTSSGSLTVRRSPSTSSASVGSLPRGAQVDVYSYVKGDSVYGNNNWYETNSGGYFSAYYTDHPNPSNTNYGGIDTNPPANTGNVTYGTIRTAGGNINVRSAPNTTSSVVASIPNGLSVTIDGVVTGASVSGNSTWYSINTPHIGYVSSVYVQVSGTV